MAISRLGIERLILHPDMRVRAGGWEATVRTLSMNGWNFDLYERPDRLGIMLTMSSTKANMVGNAMIDSFDLSPHFINNGIYMPDNMVMTCEISREIHMPVAPIHLANAEIGLPISPGQDQWHIFTAAETSDTAEIIVTPEKIPMLLDEIRKAQEPHARELLHRQRQREPDLAELRTSAKILTFGT